MAYKKQSERLLGGSLNLRFDSAEVPPSHSLELTNCRPDMIGRVVARRGAQGVISALGATDLHTLAKRPGSTGLHLGAGANFYRNNGGSALFTGFDGEPLGIATQNGWLWVMNRNARKKDNGASLFDWLPAAPATAPTVAAGAQESKTLSAFHGASESTLFRVTDNEGIEVYPGTPDPGKYPDAGADPPAFFDSATKVVAATDSLRLRPTYSGVWEATKTFEAATSFTIDGKIRESDRLRFHLLALDPDAIVSLSLSVDVANGDFTTDYYTVDIPQSKIAQSRKTWIPIEVVRHAGSSRQLLADDPEYIRIQQTINSLREHIGSGEGDYGDEYELSRLEDELAVVSERVLAESAGFRRIGNDTSKSWANTKALRITVRVTRPTYIWFDEWTIFGGISGSFEGDVYYRVTYDTDAAHESNPGPLSTMLHVSRQGVALTAIPTSGDSQVTRRHIYRGGGTLGGFYRVHTLADNVTTTWTDNVDDDAATDGILLSLDHDPPPAARGLAGPFFGRLVAFNTDAFPNRFWWSHINRPQHFPATSWNDVGERNAGIVAVTQHGRILVFYKTDSIHILAGDPDTNGQLEEADMTVGTLGRQAVANAGDVDYLAGPDGIYEFNMNRARLISQAIDPIFRGEAVTIGPGVAIQPISSDPTARSRTVVTYARGFVRVSYAQTGASYPNRELIYHVESGQWAQNNYNLTDGGWRSMLYDPNVDDLYGGQRNGIYYRLDDQLTDGGQARTVNWQSGYHDQGDPDRWKVYEDLALEYNTGGANVTLKAFFDNGESELTLGTLAANGRTRVVWPIAAGLGRRARNMAIRTEGAISTVFALFDATLHFYAMPRRARAWDSGLVDLGDRRAKRLWALEADVEADGSGSLAYAVHSDIPTRTIASREAGSKSIPGVGRHRLFILPAATIEGSLFRFVLTSSNEFYLHAVRVAVLPFGVHVDGTIGEYWRTEPLTLLG